MSALQDDAGRINVSLFDWRTFECQTLVASRLVEAVYKLEHDRRKKLVEPEAQVRCLWENFGFSSPQILIDKKDNSIYGAVFAYKSELYNALNHLGKPPRYVIAFRGTLLKPETWFNDAGLDIRCMYLDNLKGGQRFKDALAIQTYVSKHGKEGLWLAGHSLGAGIALLSGKIMAKSGVPLQAYIFNPPISSVILTLLSDELKVSVRAVVSLCKAVLVKAFRRDKGQKEDAFKKLASWRPYVYVNPSDPICSEYIDYFKHRTKISEMGMVAEKMVNCAARFEKPLHVLPSAHLITNTSKSQGSPVQAHKIRQWWGPSSGFKRELYELNI